MEHIKKKYGILSCNIHVNFTNYGSALQTYALQKVINRISPEKIEAIVIDYCPKVLEGVDILNPFKNMWDQDDESQKNCLLTLPSIKTNKEKFDCFYKDQYNLSANKYTSLNLNDSLFKEDLSGYVIGSDTVFCIEEFNFDDGYMANFPALKGRSVSYAASFGDSKFDKDSLQRLDSLLNNFKALGIREEQMIPYIKKHVNCPVSRTIDPTLLLDADDYKDIIASRQYNEPYLLLYSRRFNKNMEEYARKIANKNGWKLIEISLRAINSEKGSIMRYDAGVEEFLSLVKNSEMVVTNSFHGMIFSVQFRRQFVAFSRNECDSKITELLDLFGIKGHLLTTIPDEDPNTIDFTLVHNRIKSARTKSLDFLKQELTEYIND